MANNGLNNLIQYYGKECGTKLWNDQNKNRDCFVDASGTGPNFTSEETRKITERNLLVINRKADYLRL